MPDLTQSLQTRDIGHLRIVADTWGVELIETETESAIKELVSSILDPALTGEVVETLPPEAMSALQALAAAGGRLPWVVFVRKFGDIREMGPGRRDREQVYLSPISPAETLFYRAMLAKAFFDTASGGQEFAYIPDDLLKLIKNEPFMNRSLATTITPTMKPIGRPASPAEREHPLPACDRLLDDATTLLVALRMGKKPVETPVPPLTISQFLAAAKIVVEDVPQSETVRTFLEADRHEALRLLTSTWQKSDQFNELRMVPGLICEGEWSNQPLVTREFLLNLLESNPRDQWWSLSSFVRAIKEDYPDFQRPAGDYDSWFIKRQADGEFLRGFAHWDEVDGALIRFFITGPLYWLGRVELARHGGKDEISAFRIPAKVTPRMENAKLHVASRGKVSVPRYFPRAVRYQIARFCEWGEEKKDEYPYQVTTNSLAKAREQGLKVNQLLSLLAKNSAAEIPPAFIKALKRWEQKGTEAHVEMQTILRVGSPDMLEELRRSKAGRFLGEPLGPVTVIVKPGAQGKVIDVLAEMGFLAEEQQEDTKEEKPLNQI